MNIGTTAQSPDGTIQVSVLIDGTRQALYRRPGDSKVFVAGIPGHAYTLQAVNLTGGRVEILCAVDQRNTLKDEPADMHASGGMVVPPYGAWSNHGWRLNDSEVADFIFADPSASIAAQATGSTAGTGVIGFAAYRELGRYTPPAVSNPAVSNMPFLGHVSARSVSAAAVAAPGGASPDVVEDVATASALGTGMGALREDRVGRTSFTRSGTPDVLVIGYDTEDRLRAQGILGPREPEAFPGAGTGYGKYATGG